MSTGFALFCYTFYLIDLGLGIRCLNFFRNLSQNRKSVANSVWYLEYGYIHHLNFALFNQFNVLMFPCFISTFISQLFGVIRI
jgi:hypothetical protein